MSRKCFGLYSDTVDFAYSNPKLPLNVGEHKANTVDCRSAKTRIEIIGSCCAIGQTRRAQCHSRQSSWQNLKIKSFIGTSENAVMMQVWTAAVATMLIEILRRLSRYSWSFSRLLKFVGLNLLTYKKLNVWINRPDFRSDIDRSKEKRRQMTLEFE